MSGKDATLKAMRSTLGGLQGRHALHFGIEGREVPAQSIEQSFEIRHQVVVGSEHSERRIVGPGDPASYLKPSPAFPLEHLVVVAQLRHDRALVEQLFRVGPVAVIAASRRAR